jgi:hypothetical protein
MNPNVTFGPLGVGGAHQNSGNSAGLQPTTQSNSGMNAGLVGGFDAKKAKQYSLAILRIPTSGTSKMARAQLTIKSISSVNVDCKRLGPELGYRYVDIVDYILLPFCCKPPRYVLYKCTYVPHDGTFSASNQGQTLDV